MRALDEAPYLDLFSDEFHDDPFTTTARIRAESSVARTPIGCVVISREAVHALLAEPRLQSSLMHLVRMQGVTEGRLYELTASALLSLDGADHARIRRLVNRSFTPRAVDPHRPVMRELANELVDGFAPEGSCEFMSAFADHYPVRVICHLLGVPGEDAERFAHWGDALTYILSLELSMRLQEIDEALTHLNVYLDDLIDDRQRAPRDDLVSELISASEEGDRLDALELRALIGGLLFAGYDTTRNQLGMAMTLFCEHPDQWKLLAAQPELAPRAVEEVLRVAGVIAAVPRVAAEDLDIDGWHIPAGTLVSLGVAAANRDPAVYTDPERLDITIEHEQQLTFGGGPHYCLGANLARAELQEALPILAHRLGELALDGEPEWRSFAAGIFGPTRLPLRFTG